MDRNIQLPVCVDKHQCDCFSSLISTVPNIFNNQYIKVTINWLQLYIQEIYLHVNKDIVGNTNHFKSIKVGLVVHAYTHFLKSINHCETFLRENRCLDLTITVNPEVTIPLIVFIHIYSKWSTIFSEMLIVFFKPHNDVPINQYQYAIQLHLNFLTNIQKSLDTKVTLTYQE